MNIIYNSISDSPHLWYYRHSLQTLREKIDSGAFSGETLKAAESLYKEVQSRKSALGDILNQARKNAEKLE